jgi:dihydroneopterin aldolase
MVGTCGLHGLRVDCVLGVYGREREQPQTILVDVELDYDFAAAAASDEVGDAVDYDRVAAEVTALAVRRQFRLLESMAEETVAMLLDQLSAVQTVRIEIRKPQAVRAASWSFVRLERGRR